MLPEQTSSFEERMQRIEGLVQQLEGCSDPAAQGAARELAATLLELHAAGLARMVKIVSEAGDAGRAALNAWTGDALVRSLLLLHDLHPESMETRVRQALDNVRPRLASHRGGVELLGISDGVVRLAMQGNCDGCPSSQATLQSVIEQAICEAAPDVLGIEVEGAGRGAADLEIVPLELTLNSR